MDKARLTVAAARQTPLWAGRAVQHLLLKLAWRPEPLPVHAADGAAATSSPAATASTSAASGTSAAEAAMQAERADVTVLERLVVDPLSVPTATVRVPVNVARYLLRREALWRGRESCEWPTSAMSLAELLALRDMCLGSTAAYVLARLGSTALDAFLRESLPEFRADLTLSDDDHVLLVSDSLKTAYFSCRGTDGQSTERKRRDVLAYYAIVMCRHVDPKDHPRIVNTLKEAKQAHQRYAVERGYAFHCIGHSFGGFAATVCAQELDCMATNFNGPVYRPDSGERLSTSVVEAAAAVAAEADTAEDRNPWTPAEQPQEPAAAVTDEKGAETARDSELRAAWSAATLRDALRKIYPPGPSPAAEPPQSQSQSQPSPAKRVVTRRGFVHHVQLGNDVVSLVGGALPHECERYTRLRYDGAQSDVAGAHFRYNIMKALDRDIRAAAARAGVDVEPLLRPSNEHRVPWLQPEPSFDRVAPHHYHSLMDDDKATPTLLLPP